MTGSLEWRRVDEELLQMPTEGHFSRCVTRRVFSRSEKAFGLKRL